MWLKNQPHIHSLLGILVLFILVSTASAANRGSDILDKGRNITDGDTLVSADGSFTLGFFPSGVLAKRYLGIWFSVSEDAICWVANRDRPLTDARGALVISDTGSLFLLDSFGQVVWSSNTTGAASTMLQLHNSGNLVLSDGSANGAAIWQSFDHPSNTLLPSMKIGKNLWTREEWYLTSWASANDPATGKFRYITDGEGVPQNILLDGDKMIYRSGPWNGLRFSGVTEMTSYSDKFAYQLTSSSSEVTYSYVSKAEASFSRLLLTDDGVYQRLVWDPTSRLWKIFFQAPRDICDHYGRCGAFGLCNANAPSTSFCSCVQGFSPTSPVQWKMRDTSNGCRRKMVLDCGNGMSSTTDGFVVIDGVKLPNTHNVSVDASITLEECRARCLANCSCLAYAPLDLKGGGAGTGCIIWTEDLMDLRYVDGGQILYLRSTKSELDGPSVSMFPTGIVIGVSVALIIILVLLAFWVIITRRRHRVQRVLVHNGLRVTGGSDSHSPNPASPMTSVPTIDLHTIIEATGSFSDANKVVEEGFSVVYKGQLPGGTMVAVKRLKQSLLTDKGRQHFSREVEVMSTLTHVNLAKLLYYCREGDEWILVYEWMEKKSLNLYIFGEEGLRSSLSWAQRREIIRGVAIGVEFLHGRGFIHRDLKPANILVSDTWVPKIADFATAKLFIDEQTDLTLVQTRGYVAPEYIGEGALTYKCDLYSFGVVLLEIVSGQRRTSNATFLPDAWELWNQCKSGELLDVAVGGEPEGEVLSGLLRCIQIGLLCVQYLPEHRPSMSEVVAMLNNSSQLPRPLKPTPNSRPGPGAQPGPSRTFLLWLFCSCGRDPTSPGMEATV
ncbi:receptor-like serine/threonine-protein kinase SD1-8 [Triticum dicoccoides]|uniref:receptor-like serine/threonine-protein kinase SD1-8 n=2 Tax=Triticum dicoccoides TaxID=85692 RepID=UPI00188EE9FF|nr:receptor-like serine/threonine-protein kinase SD1-8 [Triticum dicoccoides]